MLTYRRRVKELGGRSSMYTDRKIDFEIIHKKRTCGYSMPTAHEHPYYEMGYLIGGTRKIFINHTVYLLRAGDLFIIRKNEIHRAVQVGNEGTNDITISFSEDYLKPLKKRYGEELVEAVLEKRIFHFELKQKRNIEKQMHHMLSDYRHPDEFTSHLQELFLQEIFIQLLRLVETVACELSYNKDEENLRMEKAAKYMSTHFQKDITLPKIAAQYGVSTSYFAKKFKAVTGFSFKEYLTAIRIKEACSLLIQSNMTITEIALKCGFNDSNYFGDAFKKVKGVSPRAYRKVSGFI